VAPARPALPTPGRGRGGCLLYHEHRRTGASRTTDPGQGPKTQGSRACVPRCVLEVTGGRSLSPWWTHAMAKRYRAHLLRRPIRATSAVNLAARESLNPEDGRPLGVARE
jgi:hypothetical protein